MAEDIKFDTDDDYGLELIDAKNCPFCGSDAIALFENECSPIREGSETTIGKSYIFCEECDCRGPSYVSIQQEDLDHSLHCGHECREDRAVKFWNERCKK